MSTGLLLGAGASYELGMPLVWDVTHELNTLINAGKLRELRDSARASGFPAPNDRAIEHLISVMERADFHYEHVVGNLQAEGNRPGVDAALRQSYHHLTQWYIEHVDKLLTLRIFNNEDYFVEGLRFIDGIAGLARLEQPLWIFSTNHDPAIECLAAQQEIPLRCGLRTPGTLPLRAAADIIGELPVELLMDQDYQREGMLFFQLGEQGINLLKIHGSLDLFANGENGENLLRLSPFVDSSDKERGPLRSLRAANELLTYCDPATGKKPPVGITNHVIYGDCNGQMQLLRRTLLAGTIKFGNAYQVMPRHYLDAFEGCSNHVTRLIAIGCSFGDAHINEVLRKWLSFTSARKLEIVAPRAEIPPLLHHLAPQIDVHRLRATMFLERFSPIPLTRAERSLRERRTKTSVRTFPKASRT